jgi:hypothetical protein
LFGLLRQSLSVYSRLALNLQCSCLPPRLQASTKRPGLLCICLFKSLVGPGAVAHPCNPSYLGG